ncbi:MAG: DUF3179 domain-containing protein [Rhodospirillales bacterium]|nr:DUF3179 domain-containing protein [Rhodospirillales bacterium]MDP6646687.1 DUF3179 domain-containing protein [Rhodospirillales bacterium]MDP6841772.1 DUF3179 domain-containing protein [Rhodospirillales bacterium]
MSGGPPKDGIRSIDSPTFDKASDVSGIGPKVPVISLVLNGDARAYPLGILMNHEIVNDRVGGVPVVVTYCPLCNSSIVFDARLDGKVLEFGVSGKLRNSDMVMYDRNTQSWWQQFLGVGIVGEMTDKKLKTIPSRVESFERFVKKHPGGKVLRPIYARGRAGLNPYTGYDSAPRPFLYRGSFPKGIPPMARVVAVGKEAWSLELLRKKKKIESGKLVISWADGQNSALDRQDISTGRDVGNVVVQRKTDKGLVDEVYDVTFAFVFHAFRPKGKLNHIN